MKRPDMTGLRAGARGMGLLGAVVAVGAVLLWAALSHAQPASQSIASILEAKAQRTPAQRKLSSQLLDATGSAQPSEGVARRQAPGAGVKDKQAPTTDVEDAVVTVDIRADVTPAVLARIQDLGGTVLSSVPKYRAIRAQLPLTALEPLATLEAVQSIRPADQPITHQVLERSAVAQAMVAVSNNTPSRGGRCRPPGERGAQYARCGRHGHQRWGALGRRGCARRAAGDGRGAGRGHGPARAGGRCDFVVLQPEECGNRGDGHVRDRARPRAGRRAVFRDRHQRVGADGAEHRRSLRGRAPTLSSTTSGICWRRPSRTASSPRRSARRSPTAATTSRRPATAATRTTARPASGKATSLPGRR